MLPEMLEVEGAEPENNKIPDMKYLPGTEYIVYTFSHMVESKQVTEI